jgi:agmatine deiminase
VPEDEQALEVLKGVFTGRKIIPVLSRDILLGGGNLHCITQNVPA